MTTTAANDNRPASFDAAILGYMDALQRMAKRLAREEYEPLVNDTVAFACERWTNFRGDPSAKGSGFYSWLMLNMRAIRQTQTKRKKLDTCSIEAFPGGNTAHFAVAAGQEMAVELAKLTERLRATRNGRILLRQANGEALHDIGASLGLSREGVRQICIVERAALGRMAA